MMVALSEGVGLNREQLTTTTLIWRGCTPVLLRRSRIAVKQTWIFFGGVSVVVLG
jgi:hypothetical protein